MRPSLCAPIAKVGLRLGHAASIVPPARLHAEGDGRSAPCPLLCHWGHKSHQGCSVRELCPAPCAHRALCRHPGNHWSGFAMLIKTPRRSLSHLSPHCYLRATLTGCPVPYRTPICKPPHRWGEGQDSPMKIRPVGACAMGSRWLWGDHSSMGGRAVLWMMGCVRPIGSLSEQHASSPLHMTGRGDPSAG